MKVLCPKHEDTVPSCEVYKDGGYCFVCRERVTLEELKIESSQIPKERYIEDLEESRSYIETLPKERIRGFLFPCDSKGFYILWPGSEYYKLRRFDDSPRYRNPAGHSPPLFWGAKGKGRTLYIVEGEINAMSIAASLVDSDICSPGGVSEFGMSKKTEAFLTEYAKYDKVVIVVDKDAPGVLAAIELKSSLLKRVSDVGVVLMERDANEIYCNEGPEAVREALRQVL